MNFAKMPRYARMLVTLFAVTILTGCSDDSSGNGGDADNVETGPAGDLSIDFTPGSDADVDAGQDVESDAEDDIVVSPTLGQDCFDSNACGVGEVCVGQQYGNPGYCTILNCGDSSDCNFGTDDVFCCSNIGPNRACFREDEDAICGDETGEQGADCTDGGQSDCDGDSYFCIELYGDNICSGFCNPAAAAGAPGSCDEPAWCYDTGGGNGLCVPGGELEQGDPCAYNQTDCGEGMFCEGGFEDPPNPGSFCATVCERDSECNEDAGEWCRVFPGAVQGSCLPSGDLEEGDSCAEDRFACGPRQYCINDGTRNATCLSLCQADRDCVDDTFYCNFFNARIGVCWPTGDPDVEVGDPCGADPTICGEDGFCIGGFGNNFNDDAYCTLNCEDDDEVCGDNFYCADLGENGFFCLPDGDTELRAACATARDCPRAAFCRYHASDAGRRGPPPSGGADDCEDDEWCSGSDEEDGVCIPFGTEESGEDCSDDPFSCIEDAFCGGAGPVCLANCTDERTCAAA